MATKKRYQSLIHQFIRFPTKICLRSIVSCRMAGFQPLAAGWKLWHLLFGPSISWEWLDFLPWGSRGSLVWGSGTYFAREARYANQGMDRALKDFLTLTLFFFGYERWKWFFKHERYAKKKGPNAWGIRHFWTQLWFQKFIHSYYDPLHFFAAIGP